jgi:sialic acid synthase SpsE
MKTKLVKKLEYAFYNAPAHGLTSFDLEEVEELHKLICDRNDLASCTVAMLELINQLSGLMKKTSLAQHVALFASIQDVNDKLEALLIEDGFIEKPKPEVKPSLRLVDPTDGEGE